MVPALMVGGLVLAVLSVWRVSRLLRESEQAPARLDALIDELVATAEATTSTVVDRAEELSTLLAAADERIAMLREVNAAVGTAPVASLAPSVVGSEITPTSTAKPFPLITPPSLSERIGARAAAGQDEATIARELGLARTAVRLALQAAKSGGDR